MNYKRPIVLSIAGFDPSAGAGILADIKVFEMHKVLGMGVCTSITYQNEIDFVGLSWIESESIEKQLAILFEKYTINYVKIGLVKGLMELDAILDFLILKNSGIKIIWDPILKASAGYDFHNVIDHELLIKILKKIDMLVPNLQEIKQLNPGGLAPAVSAKKLSKYCKVFLKGGHSNTTIAEDILFVDGLSYSFSQEKIENGEKHGSGCVLSASLLSNLSLGYEVVEACRKAKNYTSGFLSSNAGLLGYQNL